MKTPNTRKNIFVLPIFIFLGIIAAVFQNFTPFNSPLAIEKKETSLDTNALTAALAAAEEDKKAKKIALNVDPDQIEKESFKRKRTPSSITDEKEYIDLKNDNVEMVPAQPEK